jgi:hypothetical protein
MRRLRDLRSFGPRRGFGLRRTSAGAKQKAARRQSVTAHCKTLLFGSNSETLFELEDSAADNLAVDLDVDPIRANAKCTRGQIVYVLTAINSEV